MFHEKTFAGEGINSGVLAYYETKPYAWQTAKPVIKVSGQVLTRTNEYLNLGEGFNVSTDFRAVVRHEYGHHAYYKALTKSQRAMWDGVYNGVPDSWWTYRVSKYASTTASEAFAESFSAYTSPFYRTPIVEGSSSVRKLPDDLEKVMEKLIGKRADL